MYRNDPGATRGHDRRGGQDDNVEPEFDSKLCEGRNDSEHAGRSTKAHSPSCIARTRAARDSASAVIPKKKTGRTHSKCDPALEKPANENLSITPILSNCQAPKSPKTAPPGDHKIDPSTSSTRRSFGTVLYSNLRHLLRTDPGFRIGERSSSWMETLEESQVARDGR